MVLVLLLSVDAYSNTGYFLCDGLGKDRSIKDYILRISLEDDIMLLQGLKFKTIETNDEKIIGYSQEGELTYELYTNQLIYKVFGDDPKKHRFKCKFDFDY